MLNKDNVEVFTTKMGVTIGGLDLEDTLLHLQNGDIEGSSSEIVDSNDRVVAAVKTVSEGSGGGLVDDTEDLETSDLTGILGSLTLGVVEVGRNGDDCVVDLLVQVLLCSLLHLNEDHRRQLFRRLARVT